jgi:hypothetical protein
MRDTFVLVFFVIIVVVGFGKISCWPPDRAIRGRTSPNRRWMLVFRTADATFALARATKERGEHDLRSGAGWPSLEIGCRRGRCLIDAY